MTTPTPEMVCPDCGYSVLAHTEGVPTWPSGMYLLWERVCTLTPGQALAKWIAQDRAETRRAALLEAAKAMCWACRKNRGGKPFEIYEQGWNHRDKYSIFRCNAGPIHAILAQSAAQGQAGGEGGGNASV